MGNTETVRSITDNLETVLKSQGIQFSRKTFEDEKSIPMSLIPFGEIYYEGEDFEYAHKEKPLYNDITYLVKVVLRKDHPRDLMREEQKWVHLIREAITVSALNVTDLASTKYVSRVVTDNVEVDNQSEIGILNYTLKIRYREI